jgi:two-component system, NtrC family, response regulator HydG
MTNILVVDDANSTLRAMEAILSREGYGVFTAESGEDALSCLNDHEVDLLLSDVKMPKMDGLALLRHIKSEAPGIAVVMMSGHRDVGVAVEAMKEGAFDYLTKPMSKDDVLRTVQKALTMQALMVENLTLKRQVRDQFSQSEVIGSSPAWRRVRDMVQHVAPSRATILLAGESGTGKEVIATMIHRLSTRADEPFITLNAAALPPTLLEAELFGHEKGAFTGAHERKPGHFELAHGGTLFLDEIGDMPLEVQVKLLRVLQDGTFKRLGGTRDLKVDVRVLTATNKDLTEEVRAKRFREDLYYRLNVITLRLPPLRERAQDIPLLVSYFIQKYAKQNQKPVHSIQKEALQQLQNYEWPGNVRELENAIERAVVLTQENAIGTADLSLGELNLRRSPDADDYFMIPTPATLADIEREVIIQTLERCGGNRQETSRRLEIAPATLYRKLKEYHIN